MSSSMAASSSLLILISFLLVLSSSTTYFSLTAEAQTSPPIARGLSFTFYNSSCPNLETIVRNELRIVFNRSIGQAAGLLRLHFHDCFVQGCDASVLLDGSASGPSEKSAIPNLSLKGFTIINDLLDRVQRACGQRVVSCADLTTLAARDAVFLSGGPDYRVPLGRRDGLSFATQNATLDNLPSPFSNTSVLISAFAAKNFTLTDLVALSGGHTIGIADCRSFENRLFPARDSTMNQIFFNNLKLTCPVRNTTNTTVLDILSPNVFDNRYYVDLMNGQVLLTSDQDLHTDNRTRPIVTRFAGNQTLFFERFVFSMIKMSQLGVLTGTQGEIRANCSVRNPTSGSSYLSSVVGEEESTTHLSSIVDEERGESSTF